MVKFNVVYPLSLGNDGTYLRRTDPLSSRVRLLLDHTRSSRPRYPRYGVDLDKIEQQSADLSILLPMVLIQLQQSIGEYIENSSLKSLSLDKKPTGADRSVVFKVEVVQLVSGITKSEVVTTRITR